MSKNIKADVTCSGCKKKYKTSKKKGNFFVTVDLKTQLDNFLSSESMREEIHNRNNSHRDDCISDVCDSDRYMNDKYIQSKSDEENVVLTLNVNLDGAPLFKSGKNSFWPIQCVINEISQKIKHKFMLLAGLSYTATEPKPQFMNLYLDTFISQVKELTKTGLQVLAENGRIITYYVKIFSFPVDSVARPVLQNRLQFNGFFGCSWCYQRGKTSSKSLKYSLSSENPPLRDHEMYLTDVEQLKKDLETLPKTKKNEKYTVFEVKGSSVLSNLPDFDCIWGYPHDYMHGVLLGVERQLWNKWSKDYLSVDQRKLVNARLTTIQPTNEIHRTPRVLLKKQSWKATEWRSWLLF
ncbi:GSCOCG00010571001-RA-CDS, partial [Cotesia congregata]